MRPSALIFDAPAWWRRPGWRIAAAAAALAAWVAWWPASPPVDQAPVATPSAPAPPEAIAPAVPPRPAEASPAPTSPESASPALSTQVAPGVHLTPLGVPPGTLPVPAGPRAHDSEPEN